MKPEEIIPIILGATHIDAVGGVDKYKEISKAIHPEDLHNHWKGHSGPQWLENRLPKWIPACQRAADTVQGHFKTLLNQIKINQLCHKL